VLDCSAHGVGESIDEDIEELWVLDRGIVYHFVFVGLDVGVDAGDGVVELVCLD